MQLSKIIISLFLTLPTAFASISLNDTEALNKNEVTPGCLNTYNHEVEGCSQAEISSGLCSSDCATALNTLGKEIMLACRQAYAGPDTLLRKIIDGGLVVTMCKKTDGDSSTAPAKGTSTTTTSSAPEQTSTSVSETVTTETSRPTSRAANTDSGSFKSTYTDVSATETPSTTTSVSSTVAPTSDNSILGGSNAAGRVGAAMSVILGAVAVGVASML